MNISRIVRRIDRFQQKHAIIGFPFAVMKKHGDDSGGFQAALITYYGFLSLFPLLLVLVTILQLWFRNDPALRADVSASIGYYFPLLGDQLQSNIHSLRKAGLGLAAGILVTLYGARGVADALRYAVDNMWQVPRSDRAGLPTNMFQNAAIIGCGALGFLATVAVSGFSSSLGHAVWVKVLLNVLGFLVGSAVLGLVFWIATSGRIPFRHMLVGASVAAAGIQLLLTFGSIYVSQQLRVMDDIYGTFAIVLGLILWIYLLVQVVVVAAQADAVRHLKLWPRSITPEEQTPADRLASERYAKMGRLSKQEKIRVSFPRRR